MGSGVARMAGATLVVWRLALVAPTPAWWSGSLEVGRLGKVAAAQVRLGAWPLL